MTACSRAQAAASEVATTCPGHAVPRIHVLSGLRRGPRRETGLSQVWSVLLRIQIILESR